MASTRWSASVLMASLILLCWASSSAWSHKPHNPYALYRARRDLAPSSRDQADRILNTVKDSLSLFKDVMENIDTTKVTGLMKGIASFASLAPGIGAVVAAFINTVLIFIPQEDPVLTEVKDGFAEVNRKLDSLSIQVSNLATDVEWFNYASVYSQDELRILNAWRKFDEFFNKQGVNDYDHLAELFTNYYEYTQAEASVSNLYHYLTVNSTSLSRNLNVLLMRKLKCSISEIGKYNLYFQSVLWKGMVLNQVYWKLIGFNSKGKEAEHVQMFKNVYEAQLATVETCLNNHKQYMEADVEEIATALVNKTVIADQVKKALDKKYSWYNWVVLVYDKDQDQNQILFNVTKITVGEIIVAVAYTTKVQEMAIPAIKQKAIQCFYNQECHQMRRNSVCGPYDITQPNSERSTGFFKITHAAYNDHFVEVPPPIYQTDCVWSLIYIGKLYVHFYWETDVCTRDKCQNGQCKRLLKSNEWLCDCQDGYYGKKCEKRVDKNMAEDLKRYVPQRTITTTQGRLKNIESKLDAITNRCRSF